VTATICLGVTSSSLEDGTSAITLSSAIQSLSSLGVSVGGGHTVYSDRPFVAVTAVGVEALGPSLNLRDDTDYDLVLSKPIGSGIYISALREGVLSDEGLRDLRALICSSNQDAGALLRALATADPDDVGFVTDVTGFGLLQAVRPRLKPHTRATILRARVPTLPLVSAFVDEHGLATPLGEATLVAVLDDPAYVLEIEMKSVLILCDPQTSGGLLAAVRDATALPHDWATIGHIKPSGGDAEPRVVVL
jgi:selenide,water dikinase